METVSEMSSLLSADSDMDGFSERRSAAAPLTCGVAPDVPANVVYGLVPVVTLSGAHRSGLARPSLVGPWELYGSIVPAAV